MEQIDTARLVLLPLRRSHAVPLFDALRHPDIYRFISRPPPASAAELEARYARLEARQSPDGEERWLNWAVQERQSGFLVGLVEVTVQKEGKALLAYLFTPTVGGQGYAAEACTGALDKVFGSGEVDRVEATVDTRNHRSRKLLERLHFECVEERESDDLIEGKSSRERLYRLEKEPPEPAPTIVARG